MKEFSHLAKKFLSSSSHKECLPQIQHVILIQWMLGKFIAKLLLKPWSVSSNKVNL